MIELIGIVLLILFVLSILNQFSFPFFRSFIARYDHFMVLPKWTFFAPHPGCTDYRLLYRDYDDQEQPSEWREIPLVRKRAWLDALWNPDKRLSKGIFDLAQSLILIRQTHESLAVTMTSTPYVALAHYVNSLPYAKSTHYRQFMIAQSHGMFPKTAPEILMCSGVHCVR